MSDWLLLKCPSCGNLFRVPMDSGNASAECSICHQFVHFDLPEGEQDVAGQKPAPPAEIQDDLIQMDEETSIDETVVDEEESIKVVTDDGAPSKPVNSSVKQEKAADKAPHKVETSAVAVTSVSEMPNKSKSGMWSKSREEAFRKMDEAPGKKSTTRRRSAHSTKQRWIRNNVSRWDEFGWESNRRQHRRSDRRTMFFVSGTVAAMVVLMVFLLSRGQRGESDSESDSAKLGRQQQELMLSQQASAMKVILGDGEDAPKSSSGWRTQLNLSPDRFIRKLRPIVEGFLDAENWEARLRFCADSEVVRPLMEDYYEDNDDGPIAYQEVFYGGVVSVGEFYVTANILMNDYTEHGFVMLRDDEGAWSVDWESFVGYSTMSMEEFKKVRPTEPQLFRLTISRPGFGYYNYEFSDEKNWDSYLLMGRNMESILYAYVKKFSESASDLNEIFAMKNEAAITVMIRYPEDAPSANQVEIVEVIGEGWVPTIMRKNDEKERESR